MTDVLEKKQREVDANFAFFREKLSEIPEEHHGKYALIRNKEIVGFFDTVRDAQMTGSRFFEDGLFSVQRVSSEPVDLGYFSHAVHLGKAR